MINRSYREGLIVVESLTWSSSKFAVTRNLAGSRPAAARSLLSSYQKRIIDHYLKNRILLTYLEIVFKGFEPGLLLINVVKAPHEFVGKAVVLYKMKPLNYGLLRVFSHSRAMSNERI